MQKSVKDKKKKVDKFNLKYYGIPSNIRHE